MSQNALAVASGCCFGIAIMWWPAAWVMKFKANGWLEWTRSNPDRSDWANDKPLERNAAIAERALSWWFVPVLAGVVAVVLLVLAVA